MSDLLSRLLTLSSLLIPLLVLMLTEAQQGRLSPRRLPIVACWATVLFDISGIATVARGYPLGSSILLTEGEWILVLFILMLFHWLLFSLCSNHFSLEDEEAEAESTQRQRWFFAYSLAAIALGIPVNLFV